MPSTVKVRVKAARNLPLMDHPAGPTAGGLSAASLAFGNLNLRNPYVLVSLGGHVNLTNQEEESGQEKQKRYTAKTKVIRRTVNPVWDEEFRFDVSNDTLLQDEPLIFKVCDSDALSVDESIGLVYVDLNPVLAQAAFKDDNDGEETGQAGTLGGWMPIYDTLGGVRGELELSIKLNFIGDVNPFRDSSAGVQLFPFSTLDSASGYTVSHIFGFVEELVVADDPEFEWTNENPNASSTNFRKSKISHETRQTLMYLLDAAVRRKMCRQVQAKGGNAVLGYHQSFDVEGDSGIVARTYGTCVRLERKQQFKRQAILPESSSNHTLHRRRQQTRRRGKGGGGGADMQSDSERDDEDDQYDDDSTNRHRSSTSIVPEQITRARSAFSSLPLPETHHHTDDDDVQLLTLRDFDPRVRVRIGGLVTARSVKYLGNLASSLSDQETRDSWWLELRSEIRNHARILCCSHVIGYLEASTIHEDVAILSITGTACTVRGLPDMYLQNQPRLWENYPDHTSALDHRKHGVLENQDDLLISSDMMSSSHSHHQDSDRRSERMDRRSKKGHRRSTKSRSNVETTMTIKDDSHNPTNESNISPSARMDSYKSRKRVRGRRVIRAREAKPCSFCHVPYHHRLAPFNNMKLVPCLLCGKKWVPEVVLATCEPPARLPIRGPGVFVQARVCRSRPPEKNGESDALAVSEALPFLEYELARQLMLKLKVSLLGEKC
jgi:C2 domain